MQTLKYCIFISVVLFGLTFLFISEAMPDNLQPQEILEMAKNSDVVIIFNSGGWGNTPPEKAEDFGPIIEEMQKTLNSWGYDSIVIPYNRTKDSFSGKMAGAKDFLNSFNFSSNLLAKEIEFLADKLPEKKIIVAGLSMGGAFTNKTYEKISGKTRVSVAMITAGTPFWSEPVEAENTLQLPENNKEEKTNILRLTNAGKDSLAEGKIKNLFLSLFKSPFRWIAAKISGESLSLLQITNEFMGHTYNWDTASSEITFFLAQTVAMEEK